MITAELNSEGDIRIDGDVGERVVPGMDHRVLPLSWSACQMLRGIFGDELTIGEKLAEWAIEESKRRVLPALEARDEKDGPAVEVSTEERETYERALKEIDPAAQWWFDLWRGMPAWIQTENPVWKTVKVHFRGPDEMERFKKLIGNQGMTRATAGIWFPEERPVDMSTWRIVDEDTSTEGYPDKARPSLRGTKPAKEKKASTGTVKVLKSEDLPFMVRSVKKRG